MIPAVIAADTKSPGEREVFRRLEADPATTEWIVLHSFALPDHRSQLEGEADFVVLVPELGMLILEIKAHKTATRGQDGLWRLGSDKPDQRGPFRQASDNMYSVKDVLTRRRPSAAAGLITWSAVLFTHTPFAVPATEWRPWEVLDSHDFHRAPISDLINGVLQRAREELPGKAVAGSPTVEQCRSIAAALRPAFEVAQTPAGRRKAHERELRAFTEEQYRSLDQMRPSLNPRLVFEGPAGTGKTLLALEARRREIESGHCVGLLCFNSLLGKWLESEARRTGGGGTVSTVHALMLRTARVQVPENADRQFWQKDLPDLAVEALLERDEEAPFDVLIVDEAQDVLRTAYMDFLDLLVKGGLSAGRWTFLGDFERQALFESDLSLDTLLVGRASAPVLSLRTNCRNTPRVEVIRKRYGVARDDARYPWNVLELTGRLRNDEVPRAIEELERPLTAEGLSPIDVCLASNIVEVGVDVPRLSLMTVVGQPKTTAQYIQATGRVGRRWKERPGLITTIYGASKPRDRSHFEKFRSYHERLYAQVEPTSVTPFAPPVLDRALHAVMVAYVRQIGPRGLEPFPVPDELLDAARQLLEARVDLVDHEETERLGKKFQQRLGEWTRWERTDWEDTAADDIPLLRYAGAYANSATEAVSWAIPTSMRNVDAECRAQVTLAYAAEKGAT